MHYLPAVLGLDLPDRRLYVPEKLLDRHQERTILSTEHDAAAQPLGTRLHSFALVKPTVVHEQNNTPSFVLRIIPQRCDDLINEIFVQGTIHSALDHLQPNDLILRHCCSQGHCVIDMSSLGLGIQPQKLSIIAEGHRLLLLIGT